MSASGHISRRSLLKLASGLLVPEPARVRAYSFLEEGHFVEGSMRQLMKVLRFTELYGYRPARATSEQLMRSNLDWANLEMALVRQFQRTTDARLGQWIHDELIIKPKS